MNKGLLACFLLLSQSCFLPGHIIKVEHRDKKQYAKNYFFRLNDNAINHKNAAKNAAYNELFKIHGNSSLHYVLTMIATVKDRAEMSSVLDVIKNIIKADVSQLYKCIQRKPPVLYVFEKYCDEPFVVALVELLLKLGADPNSHDGAGWSLLHYAAYRDNVDLVKLLVERYSANVNQATYGLGITPLHLACAFGWADVFGVLIDNGVDVKIQSSCGANALHYVAGKALSADFDGGVLTLEPFIRKCVRLEDIDDKVFYEKQVQMRVHMLKRLIVSCHVSSFMCKDQQGFSAYDYAKKYGHGDLCSAIYRFDATWPLLDTKQITTLIVRDEDDEDWVLGESSKGPSNNVFDNWVAHAHDHGYSVLQYALNCIPKIKCLSNVDYVCHAIDYLLTKYPQLIEEPIEEKDPLFYMIEKYIDTPWILLFVEVMLAHGAYVDTCDDNGWSLLHYAIKAGHVELFKLLVNYGADLSVWTTKEKISILHLACFYGNKEIFDMVLDSEPDVSFKDSNGDMAVHFIAGCGYYKNGEYRFILPPRGHVKACFDGFYKEQINVRKYMLNRLINKYDVSIIFTKDNRELSAYDYAKQYGHKDLVEVMEKAAHEQMAVE